MLHRLWVNHAGGRAACVSSLISQCTASVASRSGHAARFTVLFGGSIMRRTTVLIALCSVGVIAVAVAGFAAFPQGKEPDNRDAQNKEPATKEPGSKKPPVKKVAVGRNVFVEV